MNDKQTACQQEKKQLLSKKDKIWLAILLSLCCAVVAYNFLMTNPVSSGSELAEPEISVIDPNNIPTPEDKMALNSVVSVSNDRDYYLDYKLEREQSRSQQLEILTDVVNNPNASLNAKEQAETKILSITEAIDKELVLENILSGKEFGDAIVFMQGNKVTVITSKELDAKSVAQITDIVDNNTGVGYENIILMQKDN